MTPLLSTFNYRLSTLLPRLLRLLSAHRLFGFLATLNPRLSTRLFFHLCLSVFISGSIFSVSAATLTGTVRNGSTGQPAAGVDVVLISLQGGMETVASTKTDSAGRFTLDNPSIGTQPMLVRALYRGVNFHTSLPPGRTTADMEVFDPTRDPRVLQITTRLIVFQPNGATLLVGEEYTINNTAKPPAAFFKPDGTFDFELPAGAAFGQVSAWGPSGMPTVQGTIDRGPQRYAIAFPFRPGESGVRLSYQVPYPGNSARLRLPSRIVASSVFLIAPPTVQVSGAGFAPAGTQGGMSVYARDAVAAGTALDVSVSGTAPPPTAEPGAGQGSDSGRSTPATEVMPSRLGNLQWILVVGFAALFLIGVIFLWRRPVAVSPDGTTASIPSSPSPRREPQPVSPPASASTSAEMSDLDRQVTGSLDDLKETLFGLELRRQAGTISDADYQRERARVESRLRSLLHG